MRIPPEGRITGYSAALDAMSIRLDELTGTWRRVPEHDQSFGGLRSFAFRQDGRSSDEFFGLFMVRREVSEGLEAFVVTNIVRRGRRTDPIEADEYQQLLETFLDQIRSVGTGLELTFGVDSVEQTLAGRIGDRLSRQLGAFSLSANKSCLHPLDKERWMQFLIDAHESRKDVPSDLLTEALEEQGWSEEKAHKLILDHEFARALLQQYDRHRSDRGSAP